MRYNPDFKIVIGIEPGGRTITADNKKMIETCYKEVCGDCKASLNRSDLVEIEEVSGAYRVGCNTRRTPGFRIRKNCDGL